MKKIIKSGLSLIIAVVMCLSLLPITTFAAEGDEFDIQGGVLVKYNGSSANVVIPNNVTSIGDNAFSSCYNLTSVTIPNSVTSIGFRAFNECDNLTSVTIGNSVTSIGVQAFAFCRKLTSVTIPDSVTSIGENAFWWCESLTSVTIPDSVTNIDRQAFATCKSLTNLKIGNGLTSIGEEVFTGCTSLTSVTIPDSVTSIGINAFSMCTNLSSFNIGNGVKSIGYGAFFKCESLASIIIPSNVTNIELDAFPKDCIIKGMAGSEAEAYVNRMITYQGNVIKFIAIDSEIKSEETTKQPVQKDSDFTIENGVLTKYNGSGGDIVIPTGVTTIASGAFSADVYVKLTSIVVPEGVTTMQDGAFISPIASSQSLKSITVPTSLTNVGSWPFGLSGDTMNGKGVTIYGQAGSVFETRAKGYGATFVVIDTSTTEKPSSWAEEQVNKAVAANLVAQDLQSKYTQATTRAEFCALAVAVYEKVKGIEITDRKAFDDTTDINVEKAAAIGVVSGVGNNKFDPNAKLTREQAAVMLSRLADTVGKPLTKQAATFADNDSISSWALEAVGQIQAAEIMGGVGDNTFAPKNDYTREQSIITINRLYDIVK